MNLFEAGILPSVPVGAIAGGILCKSYGVLAVVGGVCVGAVAGGFAGWLYGYLVMFLMAASMAIWRGVRGQPEATPDESGLGRMSRGASQAIVANVLTGGLIGFAVNWYAGVLAALLLAFVTALLTVAWEQLRIRKGR
ncbi:MAG: hypothetical protein JW741_10340 [Sedimentisphaerales bacterium]|nr:hypothetical protein [Sedimentisphaerales bacterium]